MQDYKALFAKAPGRTPHQKLVYVIEKTYKQWKVADFESDILDAIHSKNTTAEDIIDILETIVDTFERGENQTFKKAFYALKSVIMRPAQQPAKKSRKEDPEEDALDDDIPDEDSDDDIDTMDDDF